MTTPKRSELFELIRSFGYTTSGQTDEIAAALLAKWGQPQAVAGGEPVAWLVPKLHTFKGAERVHFTRAPGCTMTDAELTEYMEGRVMWLPTTFCDSDAGVTDKLGVVHKPKPLYTTPQPTQAQTGAVPLTSAQIKAAAPEYRVDDFLDFNAGVCFAERHHGIKGGQHGADT